MDIVICMNKKLFAHKTSKEFYHCSWSMGRVPKDFKFDDASEDESKNDKVFILTDGEIVGYITPLEYNPEDIFGETIVWDGGADFNYIKPIPFKAFRGFRYRWFDYELEVKK